MGGRSSTFEGLGRQLRRRAPSFYSVVTVPAVCLGCVGFTGRLLSGQESERAAAARLGSSAGKSTEKKRKKTVLNVSQLSQKFIRTTSRDTAPQPHFAANPIPSSLLASSQRFRIRRRTSVRNLVSI